MFGTSKLTSGRHADASRPSVDEERPRVADLERSPWEALRTVRLDRIHLARGRVVAAERHDPASWHFDLLRTRTLRALKERGWRRVAVTSPTVACGKTFIAANLALSLARVPGCATLLMDFDLRIPSLASLLGLKNVGALHDVLAGRAAFERHFLRVGERLALGLNARPEPYASELLQDPRTAEVLARIGAALQPDVVIYDLPPVQACDDVLAFSSQIDAVLLVARGGVTKAEDIRRCERLFGDATPILGVVLNDSEDPPTEPYGYAAKGR